MVRGRTTWNGPGLHKDSGNYPSAMEPLVIMPRKRQNFSCPGLRLGTTTMDNRAAIRYNPGRSAGLVGLYIFWESMIGVMSFRSSFLG